MYYCFRACRTQRTVYCAAINCALNERAQVRLEEKGPSAFNMMRCIEPKLFRLSIIFRWRRRWVTISLSLSLETQWGKEKFSALNIVYLATKRREIKTWNNLKPGGRARALSPEFLRSKMGVRQGWEAWGESLYYVDMSNRSLRPEECRTKELSVIQFIMSAVTTALPFQIANVD